MIEIINAKVGLNKVILRAKSTLEELEEKAPQKKELIKTQKDSLEELAYVSAILHRLDLKAMSLSSDLHSKNTMLLKLQSENNELKKINQNLLTNASL